MKKTQTPANFTRIEACGTTWLASAGLMYGFTGEILTPENLEKLRNAEELEALFDLEYKRDIEAITRWQAEDPDARSLTFPDRGKLLDWLWERMNAAESELRSLTAPPLRP